MSEPTPDIGRPPRWCLLVLALAFLCQGAALLWWLW